MANVIAADRGKNHVGYLLDESIGLTLSGLVNSMRSALTSTTQRQFGLIGTDPGRLDARDEF